MNINISKTADEMAQRAAACAAEAINRTIGEKGEARILLATGESQIESIKYLTRMNVEWDKVVMFHLDEYIGLPESHKASFRKYLKDRFVNVVKPKMAYMVDGEGDVKENIALLTKEIQKAPIDVALVGIGENGHIAFNDPPADFDTEEAYIIVDLDEKCKQQQVNEGWFDSLEDVPKQAVSMTVPQIMKSRTIVTIVPGIRKSEAVCKTLASREVTNMVPATILKTHPDWYLFIEGESASRIVPQA
ncbi:MAG: glucosamine-6-phosphate deaminase [Clostridium sp.]|nr:glucosamine-6-phosphate deaminase [Clostridium sp.]